MAAILLLVVMLLRLPAFWTPIIDVDESQFAGFAGTLLDGGLPYLASVDTKPLGIYAFFAAIFALFGRNNMIAVHLVTALVVWLTAIYIFRIGRRTGTIRAGWIAAFLYAIFSTCYIPKFISTSITIIMMLPLAMSIFHVVIWEDRRHDRSLVAAGLLFGVACLFKYQAGINLFIIAFYFLIFSPIYFRHEKERLRFYPFLVFTLAGVVVGLAFMVYLSSVGVWDEFLFWSLGGSAAYIDAGSTTTDFGHRLLVRGGAFVASTALIWVFGVREIISLASHLHHPKHHSKRRLEEFLILFWFLISIIPVLIGGRFFGHYFIQLLPPLCILASRPLDRLITRRSKTLWRRRVLAGIITLAIVVPATGFFLARLHADAIYTNLKEDNAELYRPLAGYVHANTKPDETIFVWGFATPIYFFAERRPASRFLWSDWLTGRIPGSPTAQDPLFDTKPYATKGAWDMLFDDLQKNKPRYIIDTSPGNYHDYGKYPIAQYPQLAHYLEQHYTLEGRFHDADFYRRKE